MTRMKLFPSRNRAADVVNGHADTVLEGEGGTRWETGIDTETPPRGDRQWEAAAWRRSWLSLLDDLDGWGEGGVGGPAEVCR